MSRVLDEALDRLAHACDMYSTSGYSAPERLTPGPLRPSSFEGPSIPADARTQLDASKTVQGEGRGETDQVHDQNVEGSPSRGIGRNQAELAGLNRFDAVPEPEASTVLRRFSRALSAFFRRKPSL